MRKLLLASLMLLLCTAGSYAQCTVSFTSKPSPRQMDLLKNTITATRGILASGSYATYKVLWGDGATDSLTGNHASLTVQADHSYTAKGTMPAMVIMQVWDSLTATELCRDTDAHSIVVDHTPCASQIYYSVDNGTCHAYAVTPAGTPGLTYTWYYGNFTPSAAKVGNPTSGYYTAGNYCPNLILSVTGPTCSFYDSLRIYRPSTNPAHSPCIGSVTIDQPVVQSTLGIVKALTPKWPGKKVGNFTFRPGDGSPDIISTSPYMQHEYGMTGRYFVRIVVDWHDSLTNAYFCSDSMLFSFSMPGVNRIHGNIYQDSFLTRVPNPRYKVWLYQADSINTVITAIDSQILTGTPYGFATPYDFGLRNPYDSFIVRARMLNGPLATAGMAPITTYHSKGVWWLGNPTIRMHNANFPKDITLKYGTVAAGAGSISGNIIDTTGGARPLEGMTVLLLNTSRIPLANAITDANGNYSFTGIGMGSYQVEPEDPGYSTILARVTLTAAKPVDTGINFARSTPAKVITPYTIVNSVSNINDPVTFTLYPNPATDKVTIIWNGSLASEVSITVTDITGKKVHEQKANNGTATMNMGHLQKGLYFVSIEANGSKDTTKLVLQ